MIPPLPSTPTDWIRQIESTIKTNDDLLKQHLSIVEIAQGILREQRCHQAAIHDCHPRLDFLVRLEELYQKKDSDELFYNLVRPRLVEVLSTKLLTLCEVPENETYQSIRKVFEYLQANETSLKGEVTSELGLRIPKKETGLSWSLLVFGNSQNGLDCSLIGSEFASGAEKIIKKIFSLSVGCFFALGKVRKQFPVPAEQALAKEEEISTLMQEDPKILKVTVIRYKSRGKIVTRIKSKYCAHESLHDFLEKRANLYQKLSLGLQTIQATRSFHRKEVCYLDMKPANVMVDEGKEGPIALLGDFFTVTPRHTKLSRCPSSFPPPEYKQNPSSFVCDFPVDTWGLGVVFYAIKYTREAIAVLNSLQWTTPLTYFQEATQKMRNHLLTTPDPIDGGNLNRMIEKSLSDRPEERCSTSELEDVTTQWLARCKPTK